MRILLVAAVTSSAAFAESRNVSGTSVSNPNVVVHVVEQKPLSGAGRLEVTLFPVVPQLNGLYTQHVGTLGQLTWHVREHFGFSLFSGGNWLNRESAFNSELLGSARVESRSASSLLWTWTLQGGVEAEPFYGKFAFLESSLVHFSVVVSAGAGVGGTRHQLKPKGTTPETYGDTGTRFMASVGAGFRLALGKHFAVRLEVRDLVYTARVDQVNGCNGADLSVFRLIDRPLGPPSAGSRISEFSNTDGPLAQSLLKRPSSEVVNSLGAYAGVSFVF